MKLYINDLINNINQIALMADKSQKSKSADPEKQIIQLTNTIKSLKDEVNHLTNTIQSLKNENKSLNDKIKTYDFETFRMALFVSEDGSQIYRFIDFTPVVKEREKELNAKAEIKETNDEEDEIPEEEPAKKGGKKKKIHILAKDPILDQLAIEEGNKILPDICKWKFLAQGTGVGITYACADATRKLV